MFVCNSYGAHPLLDQIPGQRLPIDFDAKPRPLRQKPVAAIELDGLAHNLRAKRVLRLVALDHLVFGGETAGMAGPSGVEMQGRRLADRRSPGVRRHMHIVSGSERGNLESLADSAAGAEIRLRIIDGAPPQ